MPKVTDPKTGKVKEFKYTDSGMKMAKAYAKASKGKLAMSEKMPKMPMKKMMKPSKKVIKSKNV